ncbi:hypothetical protein [Nocardia sp. CY41]|uniref:hypothetical protein n=1 Tax=Nocardia sp. CY41 TaxID=2608686 RepID=UPI00135799AE|nr:hypothetical protein [Nocardia sp. CY41]
MAARPVRPHRALEHTDEAHEAQRHRIDPAHRRPQPVCRAHHLDPHAVALAAWGIEHNPEIDAHRAAHDERQS